MNGAYAQPWVLSGGARVFVRPCCYLTSFRIVGERSCTVQKVQKDVRTKWAHCCPCLSLWLVFPKRWTVIWRVASNVRAQTISFEGKPTLCPESDIRCNQAVLFWPVLSRVLQFPQCLLTQCSRWNLCPHPPASAAAGCYWMLQAGQHAFLRSGRGQKSIWRTISANSSSTMVLLLAEVSMKGQPQSSASAWPSLGDTSRSSSRSTLFPTSTTGTCWYLEPNGRGTWVEGRSDRRATDSNVYVITKSIDFNLGTAEF